MFPVISFDNTEVTKAGKILRSIESSLTEKQEAENVINTWRTYHYPPIMTIQATLRNHVRRMADANSVVAQRLKKMQTIKDKLHRYPTMRLHTMQDVGGCRAIFSNCEYVYELCERLSKSSMKHDVKLRNDYIQQPKNDGYRGLHMTVTYGSIKNPTYNGIKIEVQIRTYLQHLWSTAVETVGTFINSPLKSGVGPDEWLSFFKLISSLIAIEENCNTVPNTPNNKKELIKQIKDLDEKYLLFEKLSTISASCSFIQNHHIYAKRIYVIVIKDGGKKIDIVDFQNSKFEDANKYYIESEKNEDNNAVLVSATSLDALRKAYPNYFMNITEFCETAPKLISGEKL